MSGGYMVKKTFIVISQIVGCLFLLIFFSPLILLALLCLIGILAAFGLGVLLFFVISCLLALVLNAWLHFPVLPTAIIFTIIFSLGMLFTLLDDRTTALPVYQENKSLSLMPALIALYLFNSFQEHDL